MQPRRTNLVEDSDGVDAISDFAGLILGRTTVEEDQQGTRTV